MFTARNGFFTGSKVYSVSYKGASGATGGSSTTVSIPSHSVGDLIVIVAFNNSAFYSPSKPAASGTVPSWINIFNNSYSESQVRAVYAIATATNTTSGTWTDTREMAAAVFSTKGTFQIGGNASNGYAAGITTITCPAITLTKSNGSSQILHVGFPATYEFTSAFSASGYTLRSGTAAANGATAPRVFTKDVTTTDGSVSAGTVSSSARWGSATIEVTTV